MSTTDKTSPCRQLKRELVEANRIIDLAIRKLPKTCIVKSNGVEDRHATLLWSVQETADALRSFRSARLPTYYANPQQVPQRGDAVNLARNWLDAQKPNGSFWLSEKGIRMLAESVMLMDAWILEVTKPLSHELATQDAQAGVIHRGSAPSAEVDKRIAVTERQHGTPQTCNQVLGVPGGETPFPRSVALDLKHAPSAALWVESPDDFLEGWGGKELPPSFHAYAIRLYGAYKAVSEKLSAASSTAATPAVDYLKLARRIWRDLRHALNDLSIGGRDEYLPIMRERMEFFRRYLGDTGDYRQELPEMPEIPSLPSATGDTQRLDFLEQQRSCPWWNFTHWMMNIPVAERSSKIKAKGDGATLREAIDSCMAAADDTGQ